MIFRRNHIGEQSRLWRDKRQGWLIITRQWVFATGFLARVYQ